MPLQVELKSPVKVGADEIALIEFREPRAKDMRGLKVGQPLTIGDLLDLAVLLSGHPRPVLDLLSPRDTLEVVAVVGKLFDLGEAES